MASAHRHQAPALSDGGSNGFPDRIRKRRRGDRPLAWQVGLGILGLIISGYLTATHYFAEQVPLACSTNGIIDCDQVTTSAQSMIGPVPVAVLGIVWFGGFLVLCGTRAVSLKMVWAALGLASIFYLVYAELYLIGALCSWCTAIHAIVVVLFLMTLWQATAANTPSYEAT